MSAKITQHLLYDGSMFARPCDGEQNVEGRPVAIPVGADLSLQLNLLDTRTFSRVWPDVLAETIYVRFSVWAEDGTLLYATRGEVQDRAFTVPFAGSWTEPMRATLEHRKSGVFRAELNAFKTVSSDALPIFVLSFPVAIGNRFDTGAATTPIDNLFVETDPVAMVEIERLRTDLAGEFRKYATAQAAILTPVYSDTPTFSEWTVEPPTYEGERLVPVFGGISYPIGWSLCKASNLESSILTPLDGDKNATYLHWIDSEILEFTATRTRTDITGYTLGDQTDKPLAPAGDYAKKSDIPAVPVKAVKRNGTALTPDASGAVNVEVPVVDASLSKTGAAADAKKTGDRMTRLDNTATTLRSLVVSRLSRAEAVSGFTEWVQHAPDTHLYVASEFNYDFTARTLSFDLADVTTGDVYPCVFSDVAEDATTVSGQPQGFAGMVTLTRTRLRPTAEQEAVWDGKLDAAKRSLLDYATGTTLAPLTAVYRSTLNADGTFPTITDTGIPTAAAYFQFELELAVPSTVPATITGPSGWIWLDGHGLPDPADLSGGETIYISVRLDCTARTFLASVWRVA